MDNNNNENDRNDEFKSNSINIFRFKFTQEFMSELYKFSKIHQYDHRKDFKEVNCKSSINEEKFNYRCKALIIASGAEPKKLGLKAEEKFIGKGVSSPIIGLFDVFAAGVILVALFIISIFIHYFLVF